MSELPIKGRPRQRHRRRRPEPHMQTHPHAPREPRKDRPLGNPDGLEQRCIRQFARGALIRGRQYFRSGHVSVPTETESSFALIVEGSGERYNVSFEFQKADVSGSVTGKCSCIFFETAGLCKHI